MTESFVPSLGRCGWVWGATGAQFRHIRLFPAARRSPGMVLGRLTGDPTSGDFEGLWPVTPVADLGRSWPPCCRCWPTGAHLASGPSFCFWPGPRAWVSRRSRSIPYQPLLPSSACFASRCLPPTSPTSRTTWWC